MCPQRIRKVPGVCIRVAKACQDYGQRVQFSVFECIVDPAQWAVLKQRLIDEIDQEVDSLRFYYLGSNWRRRVEHVGAKKTLDQEGTIDRLNVRSRTGSGHEFPGRFAEDVTRWKLKDLSEWLFEN